MVVNVTAQRASEMIGAGEVAVIDVRPVAEWERGHVPGARQLALDEIRDNPRALPSEGVLFVCGLTPRSSVLLVFAGLRLLRRRGRRRRLRVSAHPEPDGDLVRTVSVAH